MDLGKRGCFFVEARDLSAAADRECRLSFELEGAPMLHVLLPEGTF
jgi:hypothetical protein